MDRALFSVKRCKANDLECILLSSLLCIPSVVIFHPKFRELIIVNNSIAGKTRIDNGKIKKVKHYCTITIDDIIDDIVLSLKDNPFFMNYSVYEKRSVYRKKKIKTTKSNSTQLLFWIPTCNQKVNYE